jgi:CelD/BcsL family acetyltransferase involved in cellulose biosynthesis
VRAAEATRAGERRAAQPPATPARAGSTAASIRVLRSPAELEAMRAAWSGMDFSYIDADLDYLMTVAAARTEVIRPHVVVAGRDGETAGMLVGRLEERVLPARFGYATVWRPPMRCITVVHGGVVGSVPVVRAMVASLMQSLAEGEAEAVFVHRVAVDTPLHLEASTQPGWACKQRFVVPTRHWAADLPDTFDAFLSGLTRKERGNLRRAHRQLHEELGDRIEIRRLRADGELDPMIADLEQVASKTYQRGLGAGFRAADDRPLLRCALGRGWLNVWVMYIDGVPCAFEIGHVYGETFFSSAKGFDPAYGRHRVGTFVQVEMLRDLCEDPRVRAFDFGFGDADYKRRHATRSWFETDLVVYAPAIRPIVVGAVRNAVAGTDQAARRLAGSDRIARVKRRWRDLHTPG